MQRVWAQPVCCEPPLQQRQRRQQPIQHLLTAAPRAWADAGAAHVAAHVSVQRLLAQLVAGAVAARERVAAETGAHTGVEQVHLPLAGIVLPAVYACWVWCVWGGRGGGVEGRAGDDKRGAVVECSGCGRRKRSRVCWRCQPAGGANHHGWRYQPRLTSPAASHIVQPSSCCLPCCSRWSLR